MPPVDPQANREANKEFWAAHKDDKEFWAKHPDGQLTLTPEDTALRKEWMRLYKQALAKKVPKPPPPVVQPCQRCKVTSVSFMGNTKDLPELPPGVFNLTAVRYGACAPALFQATGFDCTPPPTDEEKKCIQWLVRDGKTDLLAKYASSITVNGDQLFIDCIPFEWRNRTIEIGAQFGAPPTTGQWTNSPLSDEVLDWITLIQKVENAYSALSTFELLAAMRRLSFTDSKFFRMLFGGSTRGIDLKPSGALTQADIDQMIEWTRHDPPTHAGVLSDGRGIRLAGSHVLTGITAGLTRDRSIDPTPAWAIGVGSHVDNLYAVTIAGDLGQAAVFAKVGKQAMPYIGPHGEATEPELVGDIDGFLIGDFISGGSGRKLSEILLDYYCPCSGSPVTFKTRFNSFRSSGNAHLQDQVRRFADDFIYASEGAGTGVSTETDPDANSASAEFDTWLDGQAANE